MPVKTNGNGHSVNSPGQAKLVETGSVYQTAPPASALTKTGQESNWLHITIPRAGTLSQDKHRLKTVYELLTQTPGNDHFSLYLPSGSKTTRVDFPNHTIKDSARLRQQLIQLLGTGTIREE